MLFSLHLFASREGRVGRIEEEQTDLPVCLEKRLWKTAASSQEKGSLRCCIRVTACRHTSHAEFSLFVETSKLLKAGRAFSLPSNSFASLLTPFNVRENVSNPAISTANGTAKWMERNFVSLPDESLISFQHLDYLGLICSLDK